MKMKPMVYVVLVLGLFWGVVGVSKAMNIWDTKMQGVAENTLISAEEVKGWMSFAQISQSTGVPLTQLLELAQLPPDTDPAITLKKAAKEKGFSDEEYKEKLGQFMEENKKP